MAACNRRFLMLQGPHGPFFAELAQALRLAGAKVWRAGLNAGDEAEWPGPGYLPLEDPDEAQPLMLRLGITDLLLYGEARPVHAKALAAARLLGIRTHILEEGYLRPAWITYERRGSNRNSPAAHWPISSLPASSTEAPVACPAASWGALRHHIWYGLRYHLQLALGARRYPHHRPHRNVPLWREAQQSLGAALGLPGAILWRHFAQSRVLRRGGYDLLLLQLQQDSSLIAEGTWARHADLMERVFADFAKAAPPEQHLAIKLHPLEPQRWSRARLAKRLAAKAGIADRVTILPGGRLAPLLDRARATITVSSTAGQQVLWRGRPLFAFGRPVYNHPELLRQATLADFLADPQPPALDAHERFRAFLLRTCQIPGGFYTVTGRRLAIAALLPRLFAPRDGYDLEAAPIDAGRHKPLIPPPASVHLDAQNLSAAWPAGRHASG